MTKDFYQIMYTFEKSANKLISMGHEGLKKEDKNNWKNQHYYCDGNVNNAFKMFLNGVSLGRIL